MAHSVLSKLLSCGLWLLRGFKSSFQMLKLQMWLDISRLARWHVGIVAVLITLTLRQSTAKADAPLWFHFCCGKFKSCSNMCWNRNVLFFPAASFLNIGLLLHTKETVLVILVKLDYMTIRPFPSHDFYNKNTAVLSNGSVSRSLESTFPTSTEFF